MSSILRNGLPAPRGGHAQLVAAVFALLGALPLVSVTLAQQPGASAAERLRAHALAHIAGQYGLVVEDLMIANEHRSTLPLTSVEVVEFKAFSRDGRVLVVSVDPRTEQVIDADAARREERQARRSKYGAFDPALYEKLLRNPAERVPVAIWVGIEDPSPMMRVERADVAAVAARVRAAQARPADAVRALGATVRLADAVPVMFAQLNATQASALVSAGRADIVAIEEVPQNLVVLGDDALTSNRYVFTWGSVPGAGARATVAIHERDGVDNVDPFLLRLENGDTRNISYWNSAAPRIGLHPTAVAGVIASTHNWRRGAAFGVARILSANFQSFLSDANIVNSAMWAVSNGADVINMSWGGCSDGRQNFYSRFADYLVKTSGRTIVVAAGNSNCVRSGQPINYVLSPALAWNVISVGSYFDGNTGSRRDDVISSFTSWANPVAADGSAYEKPDIVAMGGQRGTDPSGLEVWYGRDMILGDGVEVSSGGTSFAAPDVAGLVALVIDRQKELADLGRDTRDGTWPEVVKAIVMAGATHNIVDGLGYDPYGGCYDGILPRGAQGADDCRDGAGAIDGRQTIWNVVNPRNWVWKTVTPASFNAAGHFDIRVGTGVGDTSFWAGYPARVVIAWDATVVCPNVQNCGSDTHRLNADLDLVVLDPAGAPVGFSVQRANSAEVVNFTPSVTGTYTIRIQKASFEAGTYTYLGVAWNQNTPDARTFEDPSRRAVAIPMNVPTRDQTNDKAPSYWDSYSFDLNLECYFVFEDSRALAQTGPERMYRITTTSPGSISAELSNIRAFDGVNSDLDVFILRGGSGIDQNNLAVGCGDTATTARFQPPGTYYIVVDGFTGSVATFDLTVRFTGDS